MDSFDTILEHFNQAQDRGKRAIEGRIETLAERLSQLVEEATASVRETMDHEAEELFPSADFQQNLEDLRDRFSALEKEKAAVSQELEWAQRRLSEATAEGGSVAQSNGLSLDLLKNLDTARTQSELLKGLLPALCEVVARAVVLVIRGGEVSAWSGIGFEDGESLRRWQTTVPASTALHALVSDSRPVKFKVNEDEVFRDWLAAEGIPRNSLLVPVCLRGQLMGCLYLDDGADGPWDFESAQALIAIACWMIDTLHIRQAVPSPMVAEPIVLATEPIEPVETESAESPYTEPEGDLPEIIEEESAVLSDADEVDDIQDVAEVAEPEEPVVSQSHEYEDIEEVEAVDSGIQDFDPSATMRVEVAPDLIEVPAVEDDHGEVEEPQPEPEPEPPAEPEFEPEPEPDSLPQAEISPESVEVVPPASPAVVPPPPLESEAATVAGSDRSSDDQARHEEARRFARLLISEIKLYNEDEVERGCAGKDLYQRLQEDIDRSREMYEKRIEEDIRLETDYFRDEMVRILADGDEDALGGYSP